MTKNFSRAFTLIELLVVIVEISLDAEADLANIIHILRHSSPFDDARVNGVSNGGEDGDDRDDHQQFDQRESAREILCHSIIRLKRHHISLDGEVEANSGWKIA